MNLVVSQFPYCPKTDGHGRKMIGVIPAKIYWTFVVRFPAPMLLFSQLLPHSCFSLLQCSNSPSAEIPIRTAKRQVLGYETPVSRPAISLRTELDSMAKFGPFRATVCL